MSKVTGFTLYKTDKTFSTGLGQLTTVATKVDALCHSLLVSALYLAAPAQGGDRNVDRVRRVLERFPASSRRKAAIHWCKQFAPVNIVISKEKGIKVTQRKDAGDWSFNVEAASEMPFWEFSKEKDPAPFDAMEMVKNLAKSINDVVEGRSKRPLKGDPERAQRLAAGLQNLVEAEV